MSPAQNDSVRFRATVSREALSAALAAVVPTIGLRSADKMLSVLKAVKLSLVPGGMTATSNSLDQTTTVHCAADHEAIGAVCLADARQLSAITRELGPAPIKLSMSKSSLIVESSAARFVVPTVAAPDEFPATPIVEGPTRTFLAAALHDLSRHVAFAASTEESRPALNGVRFEFETGGGLTAVATNGHRMAVVRQAGEGSGAELPAVTIPAGLLEQATRMFPADEQLTMTIDAKHNMVALQGARGTLTARTAEMPYPEWKHVIPKDNDLVATVDTMAFLAAVKRVATVASDQTRRVRIVFENNMARITAETTDVGESADELPIQYDGPPIAIGFNAAYLVEHLSKLGSDEARLFLKTPERAIRVMPVGAETETARVTAAPENAPMESLVMPLRLLS